MEVEVVVGVEVVMGVEVVAGVEIGAKVVVEVEVAMEEAGSPKLLPKIWRSQRGRKRT